MTQEQKLEATNATIDGVIAGLIKFCRDHNLLMTPGAKHTDPVKELFMRLSAELQEDGDNAIYKRVFPFKNSFKAVWLPAMQEITGIVELLYDAKEDVQAKVTARTMTYLEVRKYLLENKDEVITEYHAIRGGDMKEDDGKMLPE